jgi:uncharacterized membrane protein
VEAYQAIVELLRACALVVGGLIVSAGIVRAALVARGPGGRGRAARRMLDHASLGLDFFVAATLLNLAINGTLPAVAATAITIAVRMMLTYSLALVGRGGS